MGRLRFVVSQVSKTRSFDCAKSGRQGPGGGLWYPTLAPEKRRKDGARSSVVGLALISATTRTTAGPSTAQVTECVTCSAQEDNFVVGVGPWYPTLAPEKRRKDGARSSVVGLALIRATTRTTAGPSTAQVTECVTCSAQEDSFVVGVGPWYPTLAPEKRRKDGARRSAVGLALTRARTRTTAGPSTAQVTECVTCSAQEDSFVVGVGPWYPTLAPEERRKGGGGSSVRGVPLRRAPTRPTARPSTA